jgi:hypothetical protein
LNNLNDKLIKVFGSASPPQGSDEWFFMKLGVVGASNASRAVSSKGYRLSDACYTYMNDLITQILVGRKKDISAPQLEWGVENEPHARKLYESIVGEIETHSFIFKDESLRAGCSPDGISKFGGVEIKCPYNSENHVKAICDREIKREYLYQVQFSMWVTGLERWDFVSYDPRVKRQNLFWMEFTPDKKIFNEFDTILPIFIEEMDRKLASLSIKFGDQWIKQEDNF